MNRKDEPISLISLEPGEYLVGIRYVKDGDNLKNINNLMHFNRKFGNRCINCFAVRECNLCPEQFGVSGLEENEESLQVCRAQRENFVQALKDRMSYNEILSLIDGGKIYGN